MLHPEKPGIPQRFIKTECFENKLVNFETKKAIIKAKQAEETAFLFTLSGAQEREKQIKSWKSRKLIEKLIGLEHPDL